MIRQTKQWYRIPSSLFPNRHMNKLRTQLKPFPTIYHHPYHLRKIGTIAPTLTGSSSTTVPTERRTVSQTTSRPLITYDGWNFRRRGYDTVRPRIPLVRYASGNAESGIGRDVLVTQTKGASSTTTAKHTTNPNPNPNTNTNPGPQLKHKATQQQSEEELSNLQQHFITHYRHANYKDALSTSDSILHKSLALFQTDHPATASAYNNLGLVHKALGNYQKANEGYQHALGIYRRVVGKDHKSYAAALHNLGSLLRAEAQTVLTTLSPNDTTDTNHNHNDDENRIPEPTMEQRRQSDQTLATAISHFEQALAIRRVELGNHHPQTVGTLSQLGAAVAARVVQGEIYRRLVTLQQRDGMAAATDSTSTKDVVNMEEMNVDSDQWDIAEEHLRGALRTAVENPRGERVEPPPPPPTTSTTTTTTVDPLSVLRPSPPPPPTPTSTRHHKKSLSKKEKKKAGKERKKLKLERIHHDHHNPNDMASTTVTTLSAATAAQNLAVFLKKRADLIVMSSSSSSRTTSTTNNNTNSKYGTSSSNDTADAYAEARSLYNAALRVRTKLLGKHHPDTVASKFSLAEAMEATGDERGADRLRTEIMDVYEVELTEGGDDDDKDGRRKGE